MEIIDFTEYDWKIRNGAITFYKDADREQTFRLGNLSLFEGQAIVKTTNLWDKTIYLAIDVTKLVDAFGRR
jgi:hypothetical protein